MRFLTIAQALNAASQHDSDVPLPLVPDAAGKSAVVLTPVLWIRETSTLTDGLSLLSPIAHA